MFNLFGPGAVKNYCNDIEAKRPVFNFVFCQEKSGGLFHSVSFCGSDHFFGGSEVFIGASFCLDENDCAVLVEHNKVNFTCPAGEIPCEGTQTFCFKEFFTAFFAPFTEGFGVGGRSAIEERSKHLLSVSPERYARCGDGTI